MGAREGAIQKGHLKRLQAIQFMKERLDGKSMAQIARERGLNHKTVERTLSWAQKAGLFVEVEDQLIRDIAPMAVEAIVHALTVEHDATVALEVLKGLNILKKNHPITAKDVKDSDDLASYITQMRSKAQLEENTTEGQLLERREPRQLPPATDLIPGYSPELLGELGTGDEADAPEQHPSDPERVSDGVGGPNAEAATAAGQDSGENRLPGPAAVGTDPQSGG